uniref:Multicopper oxidase n=1 Tax=Globodera pallida TaxID=36090 RepID=A0A183C8A3_GLOPA
MNAIPLASLMIPYSTKEQPDMANPDMANPDMANPDMANPDMANPDMEIPDFPATEGSGSNPTRNLKKKLAT